MKLFSALMKKQGESISSNYLPVLGSRPAPSLRRAPVARVLRSPPLPSSSIHSKHTQRKHGEAPESPILTPHRAALAVAACPSEGGEDAPDPEVGYRGRSSFCSLRGAAGRGRGSELGEGRGVGASARTGQGPDRPCATPGIAFESYPCWLSNWYVVVFFYL
jgi:hypothetical protein